MNKIHHEVHKTIETSLKKNTNLNVLRLSKGCNAHSQPITRWKVVLPMLNRLWKKNETLNDNKLITSVIPTKRFQSETTTYHDYQSEPNPSTDRFSSYLYGLNDWILISGISVWRKSIGIPANQSDIYFINMIPPWDQKVFSEFVLFSRPAFRSSDKGSS